MSKDYANQSKDGMQQHSPTSQNHPAILDSQMNEENGEMDGNHAEDVDQDCQSGK